MDITRLKRYPFAPRFVRFLFAWKIRQFFGFGVVEYTSLSQTRKDNVRKGFLSAIFGFVEVRPAELLTVVRSVVI